MNRRGFIGALSGAAAALGITRKAEPAPSEPAPKTILLKRYVEPLEIRPGDGGEIGLGGHGERYHWFKGPPGKYVGFDLESPTVGDPSKVLGFGLKADGTRVPFTPKEYP